MNVKDIDPNEPLENLKQTGFQATELGYAVELIKKMKKEKEKKGKQVQI